MFSHIQQDQIESCSLTLDQMERIEKLKQQRLSHSSMVKEESFSSACLAEVSMLEEKKREILDQLAQSYV